MDDRARRQLQVLVSFVSRWRNNDKNDNDVTGLVDAERRLYEYEIEEITARCSLLENERRHRRGCNTKIWPASEMLQMLNATRASLTPIIERLADALARIIELEKINLQLRCARRGSQDWAAAVIQRWWQQWLQRHVDEERMYEHYVQRVVESDLKVFKHQTSNFFLYSKKNESNAEPTQHKVLLNIEAVKRELDLNGGVFADVDGDTDFEIESPELQCTSPTTFSMPLMASPVLNRRSRHKKLSGSISKKLVSDAACCEHSIYSAHHTPSQLYRGSSSSPIQFHRLSSSERVDDSFDSVASPSLRNEIMPSELSIESSGRESVASNAGDSGGHSLNSWWSNPSTGCAVVSEQDSLSGTAGYVDKNHAFHTSSSSGVEPCTSTQDAIDTTTRTATTKASTDNQIVTLNEYNE